MGAKSGVTSGTGADTDSFARITLGERAARALGAAVGRGSSGKSSALGESEIKAATRQKVVRAGRHALPKN